MAKLVRSSNPLSRLFFCWIEPLLCVGYKRSLTEDDLSECPEEINSKWLLSKFNRFWMLECSVRPQNPRLWYVVIKCLWWRILLHITLTLVLIVLFVITAELIGLLSEYYSLVNPTSAETRTAYLISAGLTILVLSVMMLYMLFFIGYKIGGIVRILLTSIIYQKILSLSQVTINKLSIGHVVNLASNDVHRYDQALIYYPFLIATPIHSLLVFYFLYTEIGLVALVPFALFFSIAVLQFTLSLLFIKVRSRTAIKTDKRIKVMNEVISGIRVIKMYAWEYAFGDLIKKIRSSEMWTIFLSFVIRGIPYALTTFQIPLCMFLVFSVYSSVGGTLSPRIVFSTLLHMAYLRFTVIHFLSGFMQISEGIVGYKRIKGFLLSNELESKFFHNAINCKNSLFSNYATADDEIGKGTAVTKSHVLVENVTVSWNARSLDTVLKNLSFKLDEAKPLMAVIGKIGSGKSTLFHCLLGELPPSEGHIEISGSVSYASQEPWVFSGTVRENILFGADYDTDWYSSVVEACALATDLLSLQFGDQTLVGERGVTLSGGQKARISLARAVYRNSDVYLLDDPLSAVDTAVGRHIFDRCIRGLLGGKCVVLVTHQIQYLEECDCILAIDEEGSGSFYSSFSDFSGKSDISCYLAEAAGTSKTTDKFADRDCFIDIGKDAMKTEALESEQNVVQEEDRAHGTISYRTYIDYFRAGGGVVVIVVYLCLVVLVEGNTVSGDWWIADWSECSARDNNATSSRCTISDNDRIAVSGGLTSSVIVLAFSRLIVFSGMLLNASYTLHKRMFKKVLRAPVLFFDTNPVGRILNRFSKDVGFMDDILAYEFIRFQVYFSRCIAIFIIAIVANPYLIPPFVFISILMLTSRWYYIKTARDTKRLEAIARSPVYSHISHTLRGLATIRSYSMEENAMEAFHLFQNKHSQAWYLIIVLKRCFGMRIDLIMIVFLALTLLTSVAISMSSNVNSAILGLSVTYVFSLTDVFSFTVALSTEIENYMVSVERLLEYGKLESEANLETSPSVAVPSDWPFKGRIEIKNVFYSHSPSGPSVLRNISCSIYPQEKVGIIGRTGAGKSSIVAALLRIAEPKGSIKIDGIELSTLGLHDVRSNISVIPQDPVLFLGAVRYNLDPSRQKSDVQLWRALENVQLDSLVHSLEDELDFVISEGGGNFSVGQRQLVCLARALLQNNKIIVMDEATANIDLETDKLIQDVIRQQFSECTVLTIAHRLDTVMDSHKIMVLQDGQIIEYGCPLELLQDPQSALSWFVSQTGPASSDKLRETAREAYNKFNAVNCITSSC